MKSKLRFRCHTRAVTWITLLMLAALIPAACQSTPETELDAGSTPMADAAPDEGSQGDVPTAAPTLNAEELRDQALKSLTAIVETATAAAVTPEPGEEEEPSGDSSGAEPSIVQTARAEQATTDAEMNVADVDDLVLRMKPMATFTPHPQDPRVTGDLVYLRNGRFFTIDAASEVRNELELDDPEMPRVWAPPEDPGRAWSSPGGAHMAFFAGLDAAMWVSQADGEDNHAVSVPNLPTDMYEIGAGNASQTVRLRPGQDYTLVHVPESERPFSVLVDDNSRHIRGQARLRVVHAAAAEADKALVPYVNGNPFDSAVAYGQATNNRAVASGTVSMDLRDVGGQPLVQLPVFEAADKELKTIFILGDDELSAMQYSYEPGAPPSGNSRVRVFNASDEPLDVTIDGSAVVRGVAAGTLSNYVNVQAVFGMDERQDAELAIYGLRSGEEQVDWSADGRRLAFVGSPDGQMDVYASTVDGPAERVSGDEWREVNPQWSPGGKHLVWESLDERLGKHHVGVMLDGATEPEFVDLDPMRAKLGWDSDATIVFPKPVDWADDRLLYLYPMADQGAGGIWVYDTETGALSQLYAGAILGPEYSREAGAWAFGSGDGELFTLTIDGELRQLPVQDGYYPIWSPDGEQLSYVEGEAMSPSGWRIHVMGADGSKDRALTDWLPVLQAAPPVPGPNAKRYWLDGGSVLAFTRAGRDYGAADRAGGFGAIEAGDDIENMWVVPVDGSAPPAQLTDLTKVFYLKEPLESDDGDTLGLVGFSYRDRVQQLWTVPKDGGTPVKIDGPVRWFVWSQ